MPEPRTLIGAWHEMNDIWKKQKEDPSYMFDTPLPASAGRMPDGDARELAGSSGELAPHGLQADPARGRTSP